MYIENYCKYVSLKISVNQHCSNSLTLWKDEMIFLLSSVIKLCSLNQVVCTEYFLIKHWKIGLCSLVHISNELPISFTNSPGAKLKKIYTTR